MEAVEWEPKFLCLHSLATPTPTHPWSLGTCSRLLSPDGLAREWRQWNGSPNSFASIPLPHQLRPIPGSLAHAADCLARTRWQGNGGSGMGAQIPLPPFLCHTNSDPSLGAWHMQQIA